MDARKDPADESVVGEKYYVVPMFPYPSGKLHMGHARNYAIADAYARRARAKGRQAMFPMGWDSFGLPAEKAAQMHGADPKVWTETNIAQMREQLKTMDFSFDWERELATHEPEFYQHTQAIFAALMRQGLVYQKEGEVWWDPVDQTVLANEQVSDGKCWRSGAEAQRRSMSMYWIRTTAYAAEMATEPLEWSHGAKADHLAWLGPEAAQGHPRLRDWCVSRQRKWGTPVPAIECAACGPMPAPDEILPITHAMAGQACSCPECGGEAAYSAETLDTFFDSAWYFLRYPEQGEQGADKAPVGPRAAAWAPVDLYVGGREHATMHLIYARFMSRAMADCGFDVPREPFARYMAQGMVKARAFSAEVDGARQWRDASMAIKEADGSWRGPDGEPWKDEGVQKMSKTKLNGIDPAEVIEKWGVDSMRLFLFFAAPFEFDMDWEESGLAGCKKFERRMHAVADAIATMAERGSSDGDGAFERAQLAFNVFADAQYDRHEGLNGLVAALMKRATELGRSTSTASSGAARRGFGETCKALWPLAPSLARACAIKVDPTWTPDWSPERLRRAPAREVKMAIQVGGRFIAAIDAPAGMEKDQAFAWAMERCPAFASKAASQGLSAATAIWVQDRALNAVAPTLAPGPKP